MNNSKYKEYKKDLCRDISFNGRGRSSENQSENQVSSKIYKPHYFLWENLRLQFTRPVNIWLLILSILELSSGSQESYFLYITLLPLLFFISFSLTTEAIYSYRRYLSDKKVNAVPCKAWDGISFREISTAELAVGDFVILYNKERVPADMILFCTGGQDNRCFVDSSEILDEKNLTSKFPVESIRNQLGFESISEVTYKLKKLKGVASVPLPDAEFSNFEGRIKLKVAPSASRVKMKNLLLRDSKIINTSWALGLVVYTGNDTKAWINAAYLPKKKSTVEETLNKAGIGLCAVVLVLAGISTLLSHLVAQRPSFLEPGRTLLHFVLLYGVLIPVPLYLILDISRMCRIVLVEKVCGVTFRNGNILEDLGKVEYILADKTGTITENETNVSMCLVKDQFYGDIEDLIDKESKGNGVVISNYGETSGREFQQDLDEAKEHFIMCLAVCNKGYTSDYGESYLTKSVDEQLLIRTALILGMKVINRSDRAVTILKEGVEYKYTIIGYQGMSRERKKGHIVLQSEDKSKTFLYVIGNFAAMDEVVKLLDRQHPDTIEIVKFNNKSGIRQLVCAYKPLSQEELHVFREAYHKARRSPINKNGRVESLFEEIEENSEYLGLIGLDETVNIETKLAVTSIKQAGIKIWMLSGDSFESSLSAGISSGIIDDTISLISIHDSKTEEEFMSTSDSLLGKYIITDQVAYSRTLRRSSLTIVNDPISHLNSEKSFNSLKYDLIQGISSMNLVLKISSSEEVHRNKTTNAYALAAGASDFQRGKSIHPLVSRLTKAKPLSTRNSQLSLHSNYSKYTLFIDSVSLEVALKTEETLRNLVTLMFCANSVCFTSLLPSHKTKIAKLLKNNFSFRPVFMAVGDGGSDMGMIKEAGIGVGILHDEGNQAANASDIAIHEFADLRKLIIQQGLLANYNLKKALALGGYGIAVTATLVFLMNFATDYSGNVFIPEEWYISFVLVYSVFGAVFIGASGVELSMRVLEANLKLYFTMALEGKKYKNIAGYFAVGCAHAGASVFFYKYGFAEATENILNESIVMFIAICTSLTIVIFSTTRFFNLITAIAPIIGLTVCIIMIIIQSYNTNGNKEALGAIQMLSESPAQIIHTFMLILFQTILVLAPLLWQILFHPTSMDYFLENERAIISSSHRNRLEIFAKNLGEVFKANYGGFEKEKIESGDHNPYTLKYLSKKRENKYQSNELQDRIRIYIVFLISLLCIAVVGIILSASSSPLDIKKLAFESIGTAIILIFIFLLRTKVSDSTKLWLMRFIYISSSIFILIIVQFFSFRPVLTILYPYGLLLLITEDWLVMIFCTVCTTISLFWSTINNFTTHDPSSGIKISQFIAIYSCSFLACAIMAYNLKIFKINQFNLLQKVEDEYDKVTGVLEYLLPLFVRKRVKDGVRYIADDQGEVTVLFCYIVGFEKITAEYSIEELTSLLDELFGKIDSLCELVGVSKIETVGNTYMACAGLKDSESEIKTSLQIIPHARRGIELGFAILRAAQHVILKNGEKITLKIGINSGRVTAGVVGFHKPQFSLVGDTVNTASRMASCAEKNTIQISKDTYNLVGDTKNFNCKLNMVEIKGKGKMETFTITLQQMMNPREHFVESRISVTYSSIGGASFFKEETAIVEQTERNLLNKLQIFGTSDFFEQADGILENVKFLNLKCRDRTQEAKFREVVQKNTFWIYTSGLCCEIFCSLVMIITLFLHGISTNYFVYLITILLIEVLLLSIALALVKFLYLNHYFYLFFNAIYICGLFLSIIAYFNFPTSDIIALEVLFHFQLTSTCSGLFFSETLWIQTICFIFWLITLILQDYSSSTLPVFLLSSIIYITICLYTMYIREKQLRKSANLSSIANKELDSTEKLLTQMIPAHVYKHLKEENTVTDIFFQVTVIYADIVGFTPWSSGRDATEIVNMLSMLFTRFDESSLSNKVYKVHTIGDCYVAMGYLTSASRDPAEECKNMIKFAYCMLDIIAEVRQKHSQLNMRIGLHTGDVIGGVMGTSIVRYDIYGTDVLVANLMESNGIPGEIVISETTKQFLEKAQPDKYSYEFHTEVKAMDRNYKAYKLNR